MDREQLLCLKGCSDLEWAGAWSNKSSNWTPEWMRLLDNKSGDEEAEVIIAPSQFDSSYFRGLESLYWFQLQFAVDN